MKKLIVVSLMMFLALTANAQTGFYIGGEAGIKWDNFSYINTRGYSLGQYSVNGTWGGYLGYKLKNYTFETGYYGYYTAMPFIYIDYETAVPYSGMGVSGNSGMNTWVIPFSFGYDILFGNDHFFVRPEVSFTIYKARSWSSDKIGAWAQGISIPDFEWDTPIDEINLPPETSVGYSYRQNRINTGLGLGVSLGWRIRKRYDLYLKGSYNTTFTPVLYDVIAHQLSNDERISATNTFAGSSFGIQIGFRFYLKKSND